MIRSELLRWRIRAIHAPTHYRAIMVGAVAGLMAMAIHRKVSK